MREIIKCVETKGGKFTTFSASDSLYFICLTFFGWLIVPLCWVYFELRSKYVPLDDYYRAMITHYENKLKDVDKIPRDEK